MPSGINAPVEHGEAIELTGQVLPAAPPSTTAQKTKEAIATVQDSGSDNIDLDDQNGTLKATKSTYEDYMGMRRMGKEQQLVRHFRQLSITSFVALATASWEIGLFIISPALVDGGRAGLVWSCLWSWIGFAPIYLSMAEMASMAPIAGAQYHWVSEFAPDKYQKFLSYLAG